MRDVDEATLLGNVDMVRLVLIGSLQVVADTSRRDIASEIDVAIGKKNSMNTTGSVYSIDQQQQQ